MYRAAIPRRANPILVIPSQATPNRVNQTRAIQSRHRVNRLARVDRRRIQAIQRQATQAVRVQAAAFRAGAVQAIAILKAPIANHKVIPKAHPIRAAAPSAPASLNLRANAGVHHKANPNQNRRANQILVAIPTVQAAPATLAADLQVLANQAAQVLQKASPKVPANRPARAIRKARAKIQVAIGRPTAPAIIQVTATPQATFHRAVRLTADPIATPIAIPTHSHPTPTRRILTAAGQAHPKNHPANRHQEAPAAVALARGSGHAVGSYLKQIAKAQSRQRALVALTEL